MLGFSIASSTISWNCDRGFRELERRPRSRRRHSWDFSSPRSSGSVSCLAQAPLLSRDSFPISASRLVGWESPIADGTSPSLSISYVFRVGCAWRPYVESCIGRSLASSGVCSRVIASPTSKAAMIVLYGIRSSVSPKTIQLRKRRRFFITTPFGRTVCLT